MYLAQPSGHGVEALAYSKYSMDGSVDTYIAVLSSKFVSIRDYQTYLGERYVSLNSRSHNPYSHNPYTGMSNSYSLDGKVVSRQC